jgi:hypothetical protein
MRQLVSAMLVIVALIHLLPVSGMLGRQQLAQLYGIPFDEPNLEILMRHRALLFGLIGLFLLLAAFRPALQPAAISVGLLSVGSFLWLAWAVGSYNGAIGRVVVADLVALVCLLVAILAHLVAQRSAAAVVAGGG